MSPVEQMEAAAHVLGALVKHGFKLVDLPGPGDLADAIAEAGFELVELNVRSSPPHTGGS